MTTPPDFPDWISPMLVKELRQGMRSRLFLVSFMAVQTAMIILAVLGLTTTKMGDPSSTVTFFYWLIIGAPLLFVMPFSGLNSISGERKENTLELIFLSRLTARRIVAGKWLAIMAQTFLLVTSILPYAVLRYYLGGVDLVRDLSTLAWLLLASALFTAITIAISPATGRFGRALIPIAFLVGSQFFGIVFLNPFASPLSGMSKPGAPGLGLSIAVCLLMAVIFLFVMLEVGSGTIAPLAENHSTGKRLAAAAALLTALLASGLSWIWPAAFLILIPVGIGAVCEPVKDVVSVYRPFVRFGRPGRLFGLLFYPGWPSGVIFSLLVMMVLLFASHGPFAAGFGPGSSHFSGFSGRYMLLSAGVVGGFLLPAALLQCFRIKAPPPVTVYMLVQGACALLVALTAAASSGHGSGIDAIVAMIPTCALVMTSTVGSWPDRMVSSSALGALVITAVLLLVLFVKMILCWRKISALEKTAAARLRAQSRPDVLPSPEAA